jgi:hypothetical protein
MGGRVVELFRLAAEDGDRGTNPLTEIGEPATLLVQNPLAAPVYIRFGASPPSVRSHDLACPARSIMAWPIDPGTANITAVVDYPGAVPAADAGLEAIIRASEATLGPFVGPFAAGVNLAIAFLLATHAGAAGVDQSDVVLATLGEGLRYRVWGVSLSKRADQMATTVSWEWRDTTVVRWLTGGLGSQQGSDRYAPPGGLPWTPTSSVRAVWRTNAAAGTVVALNVLYTIEAA